MNVPRSRKPLATKHILTRNIQHVFVTGKSLLMATMKTKGFMIRIPGEKNFVPQNAEEQKNPQFPPNPQGTGKPTYSDTTTL